ncbi:MAG: hypothetical protein K2N82_02155 [Lachnospiraceae bacterium]|nr:hypothetical protein [Lachnospiraceae bacterium]
MKIPDIVRRVGCVDEMNRVYIEDYVYSYLNGLQAKTDFFPLRAALFGHVIRKENTCYYMIYGASCVVEELEYGRNEEQVRKEFFEDYELIGYVNIIKNKQPVPEPGKGYFVFYESNEAMQNYLSFCYEREKKTKKKIGLTEDFIKPCQEKRRACAGEMIRQVVTLACVIILAMAVCAVNDYDKMSGFVEMTGEAARRLEAEE